MEETETAQREKMSTLGELAAVLAHEIKNPMNSIIINIEVLRSTIEEMAGQSDTEHSKKAQRYLSVIEGEMKRLGKVISGFLDLASPQELTKAPLNLNDIINRLVGFMKLELRQKGVKIQLDLDPNLPRIVGSSDQMKQALLNLILNSIQAMKQDEGKIQIQTGSDKKTLYIKLKDNGEGISEKIVSQIFSPYFTTKEKGSGLGLAIVRRIIREHGGYVDVASEQGKGSEFSLVFPLAEKT